MAPRHANKRAPEPTDAKAPKITWLDLLNRWRAIELDLNEIFGADVESGVLHHRTWRWFEMRVMDCIANPKSRLRLALSIPATYTTD